MFISKILIKNFRNFEKIDIDFTEKSPIVLVGETQSGKSNIIHALRLILDETLTQDELKITNNDFYGSSKEILISIEITCDLDHSLSALLLECYKETKDNTLIGKITFHAKMDEDQGYTLGKQNTDEWKSRLSPEFREGFQLGFLDALRDVEAELNNKLRSPLRYALERLTNEPAGFQGATEGLNQIMEEAEGLDDIKNEVVKKTEDLTGERHSLDYKFQAQPLDFSKMLKELQLVFGDKQFRLEEASLGTNNALFLALKALSFTNETFRKPRRYQKKETQSPFTWLAIEEPEAHLHPQLQRQVFTQLQEYSKDPLFSTIISTHSPHLVSIVPIQNIVMLKRNKKGVSQAKQIQKGTFDEKDLFKLQSYLQVTRAEMMFASGVVLVEGIAEKLLLQAWFPELDGFGISICSIEGTHFELYTRFLDDFSIPWVVITDGDCVEQETRNPYLKTYYTEQTKDVSIFPNYITLEYELCLIQAFMDFYTEKLNNLYKSPKTIEKHLSNLRDYTKFKKTWETISKYKPRNSNTKNPFTKGSLAQELAYEIKKCPFEYVAPAYINNAILKIKEFVKNA
jgi:putative ATP-dependent endonuclease of OLD family